MWSPLSLWRRNNTSLSQKALAPLSWNQNRWLLKKRTAMTTLRVPGSPQRNQTKVIQNIHNNFGHLTRGEFLRALRLSREPRLQAALPQTLRFNETLGVDFFEIKSPDGTKIIFCNAVCWRTLYPLYIPFLDKTVATVARCMADFGPSHGCHC